MRNRTLACVSVALIHMSGTGGVLSARVSVSDGRVGVLYVLAMAPSPPHTRPGWTGTEMAPGAQRQTPRPPRLATAPKGQACPRSENVS